MEKLKHVLDQHKVKILHCMKRLLIFLSPAWMALTKLSLAGNNLIIPVRHPGWGRENH